LEPPTVASVLKQFGDSKAAIAGSELSPQILGHSRSARSRWPAWSSPMATSPTWSWGKVKPGNGSEPWAYGVETVTGRRLGV